MKIGILIKALGMIFVLFIMLAGVWLYQMANPPRVRVWDKIEAGLKRDNPNWHSVVKVDWMNYKPVEMVDANKKIYHLELYGPGLSDLSSLRGLDFGKLTGSFESSNLDFLADSPSLSIVSIKSDSLTDISGLSGKPLHRVTITSRSLADISPLKRTPLKTLALQTRNLESLEPLAACGDLQRLVIHGAEKITDLSPLSQMKSLKELKLQNTGVSLDNLEPIAQLELKSLELTGDPSRQSEVAVRVKAENVIITASE